MRNITDLKPNEIFVFGSNENGFHDGGAAKLAYEKFGATYGQFYGFSGQSYAIPTLDKEMKQVPLEKIKTYLGALVFDAIVKKDKIFYLTPIGTGIAGYSISDLESILPELPKNIIPTWKDDDYEHRRGFELRDAKWKNKLATKNLESKELHGLEKANAIISAICIGIYEKTREMINGSPELQHHKKAWDASVNNKKPEGWEKEFSYKFIVDDMANQNYYSYPCYITQFQHECIKDFITNLLKSSHQDLLNKLLVLPRAHTLDTDLEDLCVRVEDIINVFNQESMK